LTSVEFQPLRTWSALTIDQPPPLIMFVRCGPLVSSEGRPIAMGKKPLQHGGSSRNRKIRVKFCDFCRHADYRRYPTKATTKVGALHQRHWRPVINQSCNHGLRYKLKLEKGSQVLSDRLVVHERPYAGKSYVIDRNFFKSTIPARDHRS